MERGRGYTGGMNTSALPHFLTALLLALTLSAAHAGPRLLSEGSRPPDFTLEGEEAVDGTEHNRPVTVSLHSFLGDKRIVVVFSPTQAYLDQVEGPSYNDRDLVVLAILRPDDPLLTVAARPLYLLSDEAGRVARRFHAGAGQPTFYLIGKDGTIKMARHGCPSNTELFATVDAMPMRRRELRERGR